MKLVAPVSSGRCEGYINKSFFYAALLLTITFFFTYSVFKQSNREVPFANGSKRLPASSPSICQISADETLNECSSSVELKVDPGAKNYVWNTGASTSAITVTSSGEYWWEETNMEKNTVTNGDFSSGNSGFSSSYGFIGITGTTGPLGPLTADGHYCVAQNPAQVHKLFNPFFDHTNGMGNMMVVNGAALANVVVWKQDISVEPNTSYVFSIWGASATSGNPGKLAFSINNVQVGNIQMSSSAGIWQNFTAHWSSGNSTIATIAIVNKNTASNGNDFALDDIVFAPVCRKTFRVTLDPRPAKPSTSYEVVR